MSCALRLCFMQACSKGGRGAGGQGEGGSLPRRAIGCPSGMFFLFGLCGPL